MAELSIRGMRAREQMTGPVLYIFSGLPGTGKTTLARMLATRLNAAYLRIDTIEQGLRDLCGVRVEGEGYRLAYRIAGDNLCQGIHVVADSCNPIELTRDEWEQAARDACADFINIEIFCSDKEEHRCRVETRQTRIPGLVLPSWSQVESRLYHPWSRPRIRIDTAGRSSQESFQALLAGLTSGGSSP